MYTAKFETFFKSNLKKNRTCFYFDEKHSSKIFKINKKLTNECT